MNSKKHTPILFYISFTILATIGLQIYWNLKNYKENKLHLINEVQNAFDNSIEHYYVQNIKDNYASPIDQGVLMKDSLFFDKVVNGSDSSKGNNSISGKKIKMITSVSFKKLGAVLIKPNEKFTTSYKISNDSVKIIQSDLNVKTKKNQNVKYNTPLGVPQILSVKISKDNQIDPNNLKKLTNIVVFSMTRDSINLKKLSKILNTELLRKNIPVFYSIIHYKHNTQFDKYNSKENISLALETDSKSNYLPKEQKLKLKFSDPTLLTLKKSVTGIILSLLLSLSIIGCLLYLLKIINQQKKSDEIKNDLISNITHEFKTPITTVSTAIEGIRNFNSLNDSEKTNRYLDISNHQLKKLEIMVEKLLETATLESDQLILQKENTDITLLLKNLTERYRMISLDKIITFESNINLLILAVDPFHFENAISNLIDNALKYGGNTIEILLNKNINETTIVVKDNGAGIEKNQRDKIFEKFYRIQKGNQHDVKGFGIGLYYSKKIIEKHNGTIELISDIKTIFKIHLANE